MKYVYRDELAAKWMSKHFGMRFVDKFGSDAGFGDAHDGWYVHGDYLDLLLPQIGDTTYSGGVIKEDGDGLYEHIIYDYSNRLDKNIPRRIVMRKDVHFMWPEIEE